jgi:hypothetical protein
MKRFAFAVCFVLMALAAAALAADITGKWTGEMAGPDGGQGFTLTYNFKQDGAKLTGTVLGPGGDPLEIKDGKVEGAKLSFTVSFDGGGNTMKISNEGTIAGDEIKLTSKFEGGEFPGGNNPITLKRAK